MFQKQVRAFSWLMQSEPRSPYIRGLSEPSIGDCKWRDFDWKWADRPNFVITLISSCRSWSMNLHHGEEYQKHTGKVLSTSAVRVCTFVWRSRGLSCSELMILALSLEEEVGHEGLNSWVVQSDYLTQGPVEVQSWTWRLMIHKIQAFDHETYEPFSCTSPVPNIFMAQNRITW